MVASRQGGTLLALVGRASCLKKPLLGFAGMHYS